MSRKKLKQYHLDLTSNCEWHVQDPAFGGSGLHYTSTYFLEVYRNSENRKVTTTQNAKSAIAKHLLLGLRQKCPLENSRTIRALH